MSQILTTLTIPRRKILVTPSDSVKGFLFPVPPYTDPESMEKMVLTSTDDTKQHHDAENLLKIIWAPLCQ